MAGDQGGACGPSEWLGTVGARLAGHEAARRAQRRRGGLLGRLALGLTPPGALRAVAYGGGARGLVCSRDGRVVRDARGFTACGP